MFYLKGNALKLIAAASALLVHTAFADSFETIQNGKRYQCTQITDNEPSHSLASLCKMTQRGNGSSIYHQNGKVFTYSAGTTGVSWYYDNGNIITYSAGTVGSTWYYNNGKVITYSAGTAGATWYYNNGNIITYSAGTAGATWYYENGNVMTYSGPAMTSAELLYPCDYIK